MATGNERGREKRRGIAFNPESPSRPSVDVEARGADFAVHGEPGLRARAPLLPLKGGRAGGSVYETLRPYTDGLSERLRPK